MERVGLVERAFEVARAGKCSSIEELRRELVAEQYVNIDGHISAPTLRKQLIKLMTARKSA